MLERGSSQDICREGEHTSLVFLTLSLTLVCRHAWCITAGESHVCAVVHMAAASCPGLTCRYLCCERMLRTPTTVTEGIAGGFEAQIYQKNDLRPGCPPAAAANTVLLEKKFTVGQPDNDWNEALLVASGHMIRKRAGSADLELFVDGVRKDIGRAYTRWSAFEDTSVYWVGVVGVGKHSVHLQSPQANVWGCKADWPVFVCSLGPVFGRLPNT